MSSIKPRVKVPKEVSIDEIVEIKTLIRHPMHSGRMKAVSYTHLTLPTIYSV